MKKSLALLLTLLLLGGCFALPAYGQAESELTIMIYLCGTDLESYGGAASADLQEMIDAGLSLEGPVQVLVQAGGAEEWQSGLLGKGESQRFLVADGLYYAGDSLGKTDMGAPESLLDFVRYGLENFPAKRSALILWDHGSGAAGGVCYDELTGNSLEMGEIYEVLAQALEGRDKLDFIGFDACLMSTYEAAAHLAPYARLMIASEELEPGEGWAYDKWLGALAKDAALDGEAIGRAIVDSFIESSLASDPSDYVTLAVTDLQALEPLHQAVAAFAQTLAQALEGGQFAAISRARAQMRAFGDFADASSDMVDIAEAAWYCREVAPEAAKALTSAVEAAVVYSRNSANIQSAAGLSILLPEKTKSSADGYLPLYDEQSLMTDYTAFLQAYLDQLTGGSHSFSMEPIQTVTIGAEEGGWFAGFLSGQGQGAPAVGSWGDDTGDDSQASGFSWPDAGDQADAYGDEAYTLTLSSGDLASLSYAEAALLQDALGAVDEEYGEDVYFDYGLMQDVYVDWDTGVIYGLFDGTWPTLEGQMVAMYDQVVTEEYARSLIPALVNDEEQYLIVVFTQDNPDGHVAGYSQGYDPNGNPVRGYEKLSPGDVILPLYDLIYWDAEGEMQTEAYVGEEIIMGSQPLSFAYGDVEPGDYRYAFCLNDVYGGCEFSDFFAFSVE